MLTSPHGGPPDLLAAPITGFLAVAGGECLAVLLIIGALYAVVATALHRVARHRNAAIASTALHLRGMVRAVAVLAGLLVTIAICAWNGWLLHQDEHPWVWTRDAVLGVSAAAWRALAIATAEILAVAVGVTIAMRVLRRLLAHLQAAFNRWDRIADNDLSLSAFFAGLDHVLATTAWLLVVVFSARLLPLPDAVGDAVAVVVRIYLVIAVGVLIIRASAVIVATLDGLSLHYAEGRTWQVYYERLRPLIPLLRRCLEYALWTGIASLVLKQLPPVADLAVYGPRIIEAIGIFFLGRALIEVGYLFIDRSMLQAAGLREQERRRRATIVPLVRSVFSYVCYFGMFVLILSALGMNPVPFLAGAGVLGVVVGFGTQSLITDVVSGFFILFENIYMVGDVVDAAGASGTVEAIEFRTTRIRGEDGKLNIVRNGDVKQVVNYSKDYVKAVVAVDVAYDQDVRAVFATMQRVGATLRAANPDVTSDPEVTGISALGGAALTARMALRVKPGRHETVATALRLALKDAFDQAAAAGGKRQGVVAVAPAAG